MMNTGKGSVDKSEQKRLPQNKLTVIASTVTKPLKRASLVASGNANANLAIKAKSTTATVSKITKLVLKPKPLPPKNLLASKVTTKKYIAKPVTIKSRSTVISHESTFRIKTINKTPPNKKPRESHSVFSVKNEQFSRQLIVNKKSSESNQTAGLNKSFEMEHSANITSLNVTQIVDGPFLQEITSAVVNGSNLVKNSVNEFDQKVRNNSKENVASAKKIGTHHKNDVECKPRSYDPIKARQLVRTQKEKRKEAEKKESKVPATKDEIKQRLNALRKNTLKIVEKNIQNARKINIKPATTKTFKPKTTNSEQKKTAPNKEASTNTIKSTETKMETPKPRFGSHLKVSPNLALTPSKFVPTIKTDKNRIGILRRPEGISPTLDSGISAKTPVIGSANVEHHPESNIDLNASPEKIIHNASFNEQMQQFELKAPDTIPLKSSLLHEISSNQQQNELHDKIPVFDGNKIHDDVYFIDDATQKPREIPFWLRPTPVQPYPYNFIMAVRKKLESITNPVFSPKQRRKRSKAQEIYHSPVARPDSKFMSHFRHNLDRTRSESDKSVSENVKSSDVSPVKSVNPVDSSPEQQQYSMDFSSAIESQRERTESSHDRSESQLERSASQQNSSNELSKSKRRSIQASQDTLSISSGILSHSSPEKKMRASTSNANERSATIMAARQSTSNSVQRDEERAPSPLTTDNVDGLHITSHTHESERISSARSVKSQQSVSSSVTSLINFGRGKDYIGRNQPSFDKLSKQQDIKSLLHDFKASLSTAIKTNDLLHSILSNPPSTRTKYSDDFEHESQQNHISERVGGSHESRESTVPSYKSQYTATVTKSNGQSNEISSDINNVNSSATPITSKISNKDKSESNLIKTVEEYGTTVSNEIHTSLSKQKSTVSNFEEEISENEGKEPSTENEATVETEEIIEESSRTPKFSSTLIEEKNNDDYSSESPTNNDLKSISLSIAKKSAPTSDDTDQASNAIESFNKQIIGEADVANESIGSDIFAVFNKSSFLKEDINTSLWSEHNVSYSTLGMCDQLLKSEARKSEDLTSLLKIREKALIDRFKGQIAWLELQKQKLKESGLTSEISIIKKKQRALLLRLNNDRKELHRILKEQNESARNPSNVNFNISHLSTNMSIRRTSISKQYNHQASKQAIKAIELPGGGFALEKMLQKREDELRRRREHVEKLLKWHQRLDSEEQEVLKMEQMIMFISSSDVYQASSREQINDTIAITVQRTNCQRNDSSMHERSLNVSDTITMERTRFEHKKQKQIHKIEKSLNTLKMISSRSISSDIDEGSIVDDVVDIFGRQLNKLWKRLTGQYEEKYTPDKMYSLAKSDLELMYEQAKIVVLKQFHANAEFKRRLIDNSMSIVEGSQHSNVSMQHIPDVADETSAEQKSDQEIVPTLNLGSSPEPKENQMSDTDQGYYFSNDNIEQISEQNPVNTVNTQSIKTATLGDGTSENLGSSQIQTEEQIEDAEENEDEEQNESILDDIQSVHSDITEDSLNRPKPSSVEDISPAEIKTVSQANETQPDGDGTSSQIQSALESGPSTVPHELNLTNETTQLIEETSFPHTDIQTTFSSAIESDMSIASQSSVSPVKKATPTVSSQQSEQKYRSDDFEEGKSADELTSISTVTVTKVTTTPTVNQSTEKSESPKSEPSKELEQRLILIDEGMKELREAISQSPVLQSEAERSSHGSESEKSTNSNSPSLDEEQAPEEESKTAASVESGETAKSEENSESSENSNESENTSKATTTENGPSVAVESQKVDSDESTDSIAAEIAASKLDSQASAESQAQKRPFQYTLSASSIDYNKVPEADALKRSQVLQDAEIKTSEQSTSVMFPFLREIPNKPPPPYPIDPVLRQLPKTAPLPSDDRIKEIVYQRVEELYGNQNSTPSLEGTPVRSDATFVKSPSLSITSPDSPALVEETNVFERIILDSCEEIMRDISIYDELSSGAFRQPLEFYNPPNRLKCYQQHALRRIFKLLNRQIPSSANESNSYMRTFLPSQVAQLTLNNRRKRDAVDEILIHELYEDEIRWTNFEAEEKEIRDNVGDLRMLLADDSVSEVHESSTNATNTE